MLFLAFLLFARRLLQRGPNLEARPPLANPGRGGA
jgi:hypothetical protein